jgi:hypothetical protein
MILAETYPAGSGFLWAYQIDGGPLRECPDRPLKNEGIVLGEAIDTAKLEIDRMFGPGGGVGSGGVGGP